jgi:hypothetical protein
MEVHVWLHKEGIHSSKLLLLADWDALRWQV